MPSSNADSERKVSRGDTGPLTGGRRGKEKLFWEGEFFFEFFHLTLCSAAFGLLLWSTGREKGVFSAPDPSRVKTTWNLLGGKLSPQASFSSSLSSLLKPLFSVSRGQTPSLLPLSAARVQL